MADTSVQITQGSGTRLHTFDRSIGGQTVHDELVLLGEQYLASYFVDGTNITTATSGDGLLQIMAGSTLKLRIRRIVVRQLTLAGAATQLSFIIRRLTTAGSGGTAITPAPFETTDAAAGATAMQGIASASNGTLGTILFRGGLSILAAQPVAEQWEWVQALNQKPIVIPAGTSNGLLIRNNSSIATSTVNIGVEFDEANF